MVGVFLALIADAYDGVLDLTEAVKVPLASTAAK
jgi:hypothetical protein